jgi:hypothetical protein
MTRGEEDMKLLRIVDNQGQFLDGKNEFAPIDKITKEDLLRLVDQTIDEEAEFDEYDNNAIKNQAHQILYKSIYEKLKEFNDRKKEFIDEAKRTYLTEYEKYRDNRIQNGSN